MSSGALRGAEVVLRLYGGRQFSILDMSPAAETVHAALLAGGEDSCWLPVVEGRHELQPGGFWSVILVTGVLELAPDRARDTLRAFHAMTDRLWLTVGPSVERSAVWWTDQWRAAGWFIDTRRWRVLRDLDWLVEGQWPLKETDDDARW